jgi:1-deoxy-D-xylulose-5-phosphate synthase
VTLLAGIDGPDDLKALPAADLPRLAGEIRDFLVGAVSRTGGHLGPSLGAVELTLAIHRVFDSPAEPVCFDTGHQAYVHKILTGRQDGFARLRQAGGLSGYPNRAESVHDVIENSHASTALSYADGLDKAFQLRGEARTVIAVVGDGALTGGMCWEALNNIAAADRPVVIVVNDNGRSYSPTAGAFPARLARLRLDPAYEQVLEVVKNSLGRTPLVGPPLYDALHGIKRGIKDVLTPQGMFEDLALKYVGPIDGHDVAALEAALVRAKAFGAPVIVHCLTRKGFGYPPAEADEADCLHSPGTFDPATGPVPSSGGTWTDVFGEELRAVGSERSDVVAITAAMLHPTGLTRFAAAYPERVFDVGIAEQHAVASAAGLATAGMHPVVAVYSTFLNRAFDQTLLDVALHRLAVTFVLDRAGVTGSDGPSHNGMWDLSVLQVVPGLAIAAPRDPSTLRAELREALSVADGPTCLRYPKAKPGADIAAIARIGAGDVLRRDTERDVLVVSVGAMADCCLQAAELASQQVIGVTVVDPRWVKPVDAELVALAARYRLVVTVEDGGRVGGVGAAFGQALDDAGIGVPVRNVGLAQEFLAPGARADILVAHGLAAQPLARHIVETMAGLRPDGDEAGDGLPAFEPGSPSERLADPRRDGTVSFPAEARDY